LSGSNQLGEARSGRRGMSFLCQPPTSSKNIHGGSSKECLKSQLLATNVACSPHFTGAHCLGNGPFHPGSFGIHRAKLRGLFPSTSLLKRPIRPFIGLQDQHPCRTLRALIMERTGSTNCLREPFPHDCFAMAIVNGSPTLTGLCSWASHLVALTRAAHTSCAGKSGYCARKG
jgi:hypothetical protein